MQLVLGAEGQKGFLEQAHLEDCIEDNKVKELGGKSWEVCSAGRTKHAKK